MRDLSQGVEAEIAIGASAEFVRVLKGALQPEVEQPSSERSAIEISGEASTLRMRIKASDVSAMRAALNSYLRWVEAIIDAVDTVRCSP
jgi:tRNA threonylcarbamoyladenosine modification (KEOPS) complex  Pcc1 subunit